MCSGAPATKWRFSWEVVEIEPGRPCDILGHRVVTAEVLHPSGAPSTAVRFCDGGTALAYSGDTEWTDALVRVADGADLFIVECYGHTRSVTGHLSWSILQPRLAQLQASQIMITHMSPAMLEHADDASAAGLLVASDGAVVEL